MCGLIVRRQQGVVGHGANKFRVVSFKQVSLGTRIGYSGEKAEAGSSREALMFSRRVDLRGGISGFPLHVSFPFPRGSAVCPSS